MTTASTLVSVVIPAYNGAGFLTQTLESVLAQTHSALEVIVVDDGSSDATAALTEALARRDERVRLVRQANSGVSRARNKGAAEARGPFLAFLDADDLWLPKTLEMLLPRLLADPAAGLVHCDFLEFDSATGTLSEHRHIADEGRILDKLLLGCGDGSSLIAIGSFLIRAETFWEVGAFDPDLSNCADLEFYFRVAQRHPVVRVPEVGLHYRILPNSMHSSIPLLEKDTLTAFSKADAHRLFRDPLFRRKCYSNMYLMLAGSWWKNGNDKAKGSRFILRAFLAYPPILFKLLFKCLCPINRIIAQSRRGHSCQSRL